MSEMTDERLMIRETARKFAMQEILPIANKLDPEKGSIPRELIQKMADLGYFGILIDEKYGGLGLGAFEYCIIAEELSRAWMSVSSLLARGNSMLDLPNKNEEWRSRTLPKVVAGELLGAFAMSEPNAGSDIANISTRAVKDGDDYVITGSKYWCTFADGADYIIVMARTSTDSDTAKRRHKGLSAFMIEKPRGALPDRVKGSPIPKIGYFGWSTWELAFDNVRVPAASMVSEENQGFYMATHNLELGRAYTAARSIGLARGALEDALVYSQERQQFKQPISEFQVTRFKLAKMATDIEASRQLLHFVCDEIDKGRRCDKEAAMSKYHAAEMAEQVTSEALQIFGGAGYTTLHAVERYWRDARLTKIFDGTSEIQLRIVSDHLLGKPKGS